ncbi:MAG: 2-succinyl-6-hydroxy-2,4-cyclohexadiene-1-carboxylate synthase [Phototrophicales bacterium]|nr:2-succinyl-6-hydroxy-2,4-cyclohexadiene-1-carboxylate synthase [Phototrophicales bacterium]
MHPKSTTHTIHDILYTVHEWGIGEPLLILHGFTGDGGSFCTRLPHLARHYRLIAPDLLGHGASDSPSDRTPYRMESATAHLFALLDRMGITSCAVLGYSMGGRLALGFSVYHPTRVTALILESSSAGLATPSERQARIISDEVLANRILTGGITNFVDEWEALPLWHTQSPAIKHDLRESRLKNNPLGLANSLRGMGTGAQPYFGDNLEELPMPVLLITGEQDEKFTQIAHSLAQKIPHATHTTLPHAGHAGHLDAPEAYQTAIKTFLGQ